MLFEGYSEIYHNYYSLLAYVLKLYIPVTLLQSAFDPEGLKKPELHRHENSAMLQRELPPHSELLACKLPPITSLQSEVGETDSVVYMHKKRIEQIHLK